MIEAIIPISTDTHYSEAVREEARKTIARLAHKYNKENKTHSEYEDKTIYNVTFHATFIGNNGANLDAQGLSSP